jgi:hypothetical protein
MGSSSDHLEHPCLPRTTLTLTDAGAPHATLVALVVVFTVAAVLVGPSFVLLFTLKNRRILGADDTQIAAQGDASRPPIADHDRRSWPRVE